jgi:hypothetical protein
LKTINHIIKIKHTNKHKLIAWYTGRSEMPLLEKRCITPRVSSILGFPEEKGNASLVDNDDSSAVGCQKWSSSVAPLTAAALELGDMPVENIKNWSSHHQPST